MRRVEPERHLPRSGLLCLSDGISQLEKSYQAMKSGANCPGVSTGFPTLDRTLGGLQPGGLFLLMSAPGVGKTRLALNIARQACIDNHPVIYITSDETRDRLSLRLACIDTQTKLTSINHGTDPKTLRHYEKNPPDFWKNISFIDSCSLNLDSLKDHVQQIIEQKKARMGLLVVDYLQRLAPKTKTQDIRLAVGELAEVFRNIAISCNSPALVVSSVSRGQYDKPTLSAGKESGELEYSADVVMNLVRPEQHANELRLTIEKNRYGEPFKSIDFAFNPMVGTMGENDPYMRVVK